MSTRYETHRHGCRAGSIAPPAPIPGATWQAGVTIGNACRRVLLDGEPQPTAIAAGPDWVLCLSDKTKIEHVKPTPQHPLGWSQVVDVLSDRVLLHGHVQIIPCRRDC